VNDRRRRWLLLAVGAALVALSLARGPVVLAAASAVILAIVGYRLAGALRPARADWSWGTRSATAVATGGRMQALAALVDAERRDVDAPARMQQWFRRLATDRGSIDSHSADSSALGTYLAGPPRRLAPQEVVRLLADLDSR
jgi:hypothetical protein